MDLKPNENINLNLNNNQEIPENFNTNLVDMQRGPIGKLDFSKNPRFQQKVQKKEVTYRSPTYVSLNYKTIKPIEPEDDEIFDNDDSDDTMLLEGKKDTSTKIKVKVKKLILFLFY